MARKPLRFFRCVKLIEYHPKTTFKRRRSSKNTFKSQKSAHISFRTNVLCQCNTKQTKLHTVADGCKYLARLVVVGVLGIGASKE